MLVLRSLVCLFRLYFCLCDCFGRARLARAISGQKVQKRRLDRFPIRGTTRLTVDDFARRRARQLDMKNRPMGTVWRGPKLAAMRSNDRAANRKSHPHATILRRKESVKDAVHMGWINSRAGVLQRYEH